MVKGCPPAITWGTRAATLARPLSEVLNHAHLMMTLRQMAAEPQTIPMRTSWYLADLSEAKGKYELYTRQSPQKLKVLGENALIQSAVSSNRIEGVEVDRSRVATLMFGKPALRDRDEEEVRGYRDALKLIHESGANFPFPRPPSKSFTSYPGAKSGTLVATKKRTWTLSIIEDNKERYYEVLEQSSQRWHEGKHDPWPTMNFLLFILTQACKEFEERLGDVKSPRGEKTALVEAAIERQSVEFSVSDLQNACPGVGIDLIRRVLKRLRGSRVACLGRGHSARWKKLGK
jgi:hypothetical protein